MRGAPGLSKGSQGSYGIIRGERSRVTVWGHGRISIVQTGRIHDWVNDRRRGRDDWVVALMCPCARKQAKHSRGGCGGKRKGVGAPLEQCRQAVRGAGPM
jgi:hypothetical protein